MSDSSTFKCLRHDEYLSADSKTRRIKLQFNNIGPLTQEDSIKFGIHLKNLGKKHYINRPENMINYEFDVLYPEVS
jgi:hypothetical protein